MTAAEFNRHNTPPQGWMYRQPQTGWTAPTPIASTFSQTVQLIIAHRKANPAITAQHKLATNQQVVENELEAYTRKRLGIPETALPFPSSHRSFAESAVGAVADSWSDRTRQMTTGAMTLKDWLADGPVSHEQAEKRAAICVQRADGKPCPRHKPGDWSSFFTVPVANLIRKQMEEKSGMNLSTSLDKELGVCDACGCPMGVKVHVKKSTIMGRIKPQELSALDPSCWILKE